MKTTLSFNVRVTVTQEGGECAAEALKRGALRALRYRVERRDLGQFWIGPDIEATFNSVDALPEHDEVVKEVTV